MIRLGFLRCVGVGWVVGAGLLGAATAGVSADGAASKAARTAPIIDAVYTKTPPVIDGKLDDECWSQASRLEGFTCPGVDTPPPDETIGLVILDEQYLYVGFICRDKTPDDISAKETRRNGDVGRDDSVALALDPWHQHNDFYQFTVTAAGTQAEQIPGGSATKIEWRGDWRGAAVRTADGLPGRDGHPAGDPAPRAGPEHVRPGPDPELGEGEHRCDLPRHRPQCGHQAALRPGGPATAEGRRPPHHHVV